MNDIIRPRSLVILLVDDYEDTLEIYGEYLTYRGHRVVVARSGREAVERAHHDHPDIILLDISMPDLSGLDVVRILRADPKFATSPIVALTARALESERMEALTAGFDEVISKPCLPDELEASVQRILGAAAAAPAVLLTTDIDDQAVNYEAALSRHGFRVQWTRNGQEALAAARTLRPVCAVIDLRLPDMTGYELCRDLKAQHETRAIRIIVLTQDLTTAMAERGAKLGCYAWLAQPTAADDLVATVRLVLGFNGHAPDAPDQALLGVVTCRACESTEVLAGVRIGPVQYYSCQKCRLCWRVNTANALDKRAAT